MRGLDLSRQALKGHLTTGSDGVGLLSQCGAGSVSVWGGVDLSAGGGGSLRPGTAFGTMS